MRHITPSLHHDIQQVVAAIYLVQTYVTIFMTERQTNRGPPDLTELMAMLVCCTSLLLPSLIFNAGWPFEFLGTTFCISASVMDMLALARDP